MTTGTQETMPREYRTVDKSAWGPGPWQDEPDKIHWIDAETDLDCLIVRGPHGALCGYVGVPEGHPWHGVGYGDCTQTRPCGESWCLHSPMSRTSVHGGLTFARSCADPTRERYEQWRASTIASRAEAATYPKGDSAERLREVGHLIDDYDGWRAWMESAAICHVPLPGRSDRVWWLGFDCAHYGDLAPKPPAVIGFEDEYRTRAYVEGECRDLARQIKAVEAPDADA